MLGWPLFFEFLVGSSGFLTKIAEAARGGSHALIIRLMLVFNLNERLTGPWCFKSALFVRLFDLIVRANQFSRNFLERYFPKMDGKFVIIRIFQL